MSCVKGFAFTQEAWVGGPHDRGGGRLGLVPVRSLLPRGAPRAVAPAGSRTSRRPVRGDAAGLAGPRNYHRRLLSITSVRCIQASGSLAGGERWRACVMTSEVDGGAEGGPRIRTPDQRVRVFVSSTLRELAAERARLGISK